MPHLSLWDGGAKCPWAPVGDRGHLYFGSLFPKSMHFFGLGTQYIYRPSIPLEGQPHHPSVFSGPARGCPGFSPGRHLSDVEADMLAGPGSLALLALLSPLSGCLVESRSGTSLTLVHPPRQA